jgi:ankyrin repeat protein
VEVDEDGCPIHQYDLDSSEMITLGLRQSTLLSSNGGDVLPNNITNELQSMDESDSLPEIRLRNAALSGDKVALEQAIQDDANINHADESGQTALHFPADRGCIESVCLLLNAGPNVNATDQDGIGVLQTSIVAGIDVDVVRVLLEGGADPDAEDHDGDGDSPR